MKTIVTRRIDSVALGIVASFDWQAVARRALMPVAALWGRLTAARYDLPFDVNDAVWTDSLERQLTDHLATGNRFRL